MNQLEMYKYINGMLADNELNKDDKLGLLKGWVDKVNEWIFNGVILHSTELSIYNDVIIFIKAKIEELENNE